MTAIVIAMSAALLAMLAIAVAVTNGRPLTDDRVRGLVDSELRGIPLPRVSEDHVRAIVATELRALRSGTTAHELEQRGKVHDLSNRMIGLREELDQIRSYLGLVSDITPIPLPRKEE